MTSPIFKTRGLMAHQVDDSGDLILHDPASGEMVVLNAVGAAAYEMLDGVRSEHAIADEIAAAFVHVDPGQIAADVRVFLGDLVRRGLIEQTRS